MIAMGAAMTPNSEPTLGEVLRRLEEVSRQLLDVTHELKEDRKATAATYVRQDVYIAQRQADAAIVADLAGDMQSMRDERKTDVGFRRQVWLTLGALAISMLVTIVIAIANFVAR
jgi:hypothetical protein